MQHANITMICLVLRPSCIDCLFLPACCLSLKCTKTWDRTRFQTLYDITRYSVTRWILNLYGKNKWHPAAQFRDISCQMALLRAVSCLLCTWFACADLDLDLYKTAKSSPNLKAVEASVQKISVTERAWWGSPTSWLACESLNCFCFRNPKDNSFAPHIHPISCLEYKSKSWATTHALGELRSFSIWRGRRTMSHYCYMMQTVHIAGKLFQS